MPCNYRDYHSDWKSISRQIRDQAGNKCEFCGAPNHEVIQRNTHGKWILDDELQHYPSTEAWYWLGTYNPPNPVRVVLTVAHLCHDTTCIDPTHLRALCQRCHLNYDRDHHTRKTSETRRQNHLTKIGQQVLL